MAVANFEITLVKRSEDLRYFFHTADGSRDRDTVGMELETLSSARRHAVVFAGECMTDNPDILADHDFRVEVTDTYGALLLTVITIAIHSPSTGWV